MHWFKNTDTEAQLRVAFGRIRTDLNGLQCLRAELRQRAGIAAKQLLDEVEHAIRVEEEERRRNLQNKPAPTPVVVPPPAAKAPCVPAPAVTPISAPKPSPIPEIPIETPVLDFSKRSEAEVAEKRRPTAAPIRPPSQPRPGETPEETAARFKLEELRRQLLDLSRTNHLIRFPHSQTKHRHVRVVDEHPASMLQLLLEDRKVEFVAIPNPPDEPPDEQTSHFQSHYEKALLTDATYLRAEETILKSGGDAAESLLRKAQRELRDQVRKRLGMPSRTEIVRTITEHARQLGIRPEFDLTQPPKTIGRRRQNYEWQTLLSQRELSTKLRGLEKESNDAAKELGIETLHVIFGFLEWYPKTLEGEADDMVLSPLLLQPVEIKKRPALDPAEAQGPRQLQERSGLGQRQSMDGWQISAENSDEMALNISLQERLHMDYGLSLPDWDPGVPGLDNYWEAVEAAIRVFPNWKLRRYVTLAHLSFNRVTMWKDIDPDAGGDSAPQKLPLVQELLGGRREEPPGSSAFGRPEQVRPVLLLDADASQYAAIVEAMRGKSLVIQGPPGTGKSQTIANLITAALHAKKTVLFVAEKQAALDAVAKRLRDQAKLGDFLLELHSVNAGKKPVLESLRRRMLIKEKPSQSQSAEAMERHHIATVEALDGYAETMGQMFGKLDRTLHDILWSHLKLVDRPMPPGLERFELPDVTEWSSFELSQRLELVRKWAGLHVRRQGENVGSKHEHPWGWVEHEDAHIVEQEAIVDAARELRDRASSLVDLLEQAGLETGRLNLEQLHCLQKQVMGLSERPHPEAESTWSLAGQSDVEARVQSFRNLYSADADLRRSIQSFAPGMEKKHDAIAELLLLEVGWGKLSSWDRCDTVETLRNRLLKTERYCEQLPRWKSAVSQLKSLLGAGVEMEGVAALQLLSKLVELLASTPDSIVGWEMKLDGDNAGGHLSSAAATIDALQSRQKQLQAKTVVRLEDLGFEQVTTALQELETQPVISFLYRPSYRSARSLAAKLLPGASSADRRIFLSEIRQFQLDSKELERHPASLITQGFRNGTLIDSQELKEIASWISMVRERTPLLPKENLSIRSLVLSLQRDLVEFGRGLRKEGIGNGFAELAQLLQLTRIPFEEIEARFAQEAEILARLVDCCTKWSWQVEVSNVMFAGLRRQVFDWLGIRDRMADYRDVIGALGSDIEQGVRRLREIQAARARVTRLEVSEEWKSRLVAADGSAAWSELQQHARATAQHLTRVSEGLQILSERACMDSTQVEAWQKLPPHQIAIWLGVALESGTALATQCSWLAVRARLKEQGLIRFVDSLSAPPRDGEQAALWLEQVFYRNLCHRAFETIPRLKQFRHSSPEELGKEFRRLDHELKKHHRTEVVDRLLDRIPPAGISTGGTAQRTQMGLLQSITAMTSPRISLRDLLRRASTAIQELKPCFLMSPLSVAQLIDRHAMSFDMVIFDEASQIRPADAISAMMRAKQFVVVGDRMQLPPTTFGEKTAQVETGLDQDSEKEVEESAVTESILDLAEAAHGSGPVLNWHYRSRDPALIAFSNREFYENRLQVFPAPCRDNPSTGVHFVPVNGVYGVSRNPIEAAKVAEAAIEYIRVYPKRSLGIVALNQPQADLIQLELDRLMVVNPQALDYKDVMDRRGEQLFVKNLESVQGDERDTIFISTVFGRSETGAFAQNFGPINKSGGHRRLNVLFTRAKYQVIVFSSIPVEELVHEGRKRGTQVFKAYLEFARTRRLPVSTTSSALPETPFEEAVLRALKSEGFECEAQWQVYGFRIDLVVRHPRHANVFVLGVECDGASYHSSRSARDRDRLRQEVLESAGWRIYRVWSTDWFSNREHELRKLVEAIRDAIRLSTAERLKQQLSFLTADEAEESA